MHHKRRKAKNGRAGCLFCKPHKANGSDRRTIAEKKQDEAAVYELSEKGIAFNQGRIGAGKGL